MRADFPEFYPPSDEELKKIWDTCVFVLDANVLLNLYRYQPTSRDDLLKVLEKLGGRVHVPFQAALEFQRNRLRVIAEQRSNFGKVIRQLNEAYESTATGFQKLNISGRHAHIDLDPFLKEVKALFYRFETELRSLESSQSSKEKDEIRDRIDALLDGRVGKSPSQKDISDICKEGKERFKHLTPPGYRDEKEKKDQFFSAQGVRYEAMYGDLILWKQIIEFAKKSGGPPVVLITDDQKEDWWLRVAGETVGPQPELVGEIKREANVDGFHMYTVHRFLDYASGLLGINVNRASIDEARTVGLEQQLPNYETSLNNHREIILRFSKSVNKKSELIIDKCLESIIGDDQFCGVAENTVYIGKIYANNEKINELISTIKARITNNSIDSFDINDAIDD